MAKVAIITDSTANLPEAILEEYSITVLPLSLILGNETLRDGVDIRPSEFYARLKTTRATPSTSQVTPTAFTEAFNRCLEQGQEVLTIVISSALSGTYESALQALESFPGAPIELIDSRSTSLMMGYQILLAARASANGAGLKDCKKIVSQAIQNSGLLFAVDTLEYLYRGGRIGGATRFLGTALNIKPVLELKEGRIEAIERVRSQKKAVMRLVELVSQRTNGRRPLRLGVIDADANELASVLAEHVQATLQPDEILRSDVSPVIGAHAGPGTVGLAYLTGM